MESRTLYISSYLSKVNKIAIVYAKKKLYYPFNYLSIKGDISEEGFFSNLIITNYKTMNQADGRIFVDLITRLRNSFKTLNVEESISVINEISSNIVPNSFVTSSSLMDEVLATIFIHSTDPKFPIAYSCQIFLDRWLSFYSAFAPSEFFRMCIKHSKTLSRFMFKVLPPFVFAYKTYFDLHSDELIETYINVMDAAEPQNLASMTKQVWVLYRDNASIEQVSALIDKLLKSTMAVNLTFAVSVLVRKCPEQLVEQVFVNADMNYIFSFMRNLPSYVKFDTLTISVKIADAIFCRIGDKKIAYKLIPLIINRKLNASEEAAFAPIWPQLEMESYKYYCLAALYAGSKYGIIPKKNIIPLLHFSDRSDSKVVVESIKIGFELLDEPTFQDNFIKILIDLSQTRETPAFACLIENLISHFPSIRKINERAAYTILNNALSPIPLGENIPYNVLLLLNSFDDLFDSYFSFDVTRIIRCYTHLENYIDLIKPLKDLIYKLSLNVDSLNIDYFNPSSYKKLQLVDSIDAKILVEAIDLNLIPFQCLSYVVDKLHVPYCFEPALGTLVLILNAIGFQMHYDYQNCWTTKEIILQKIDELRVAFVVSEIGILISSLLNCIVDLYDKIEIDEDKHKVLYEIAKSLSSAVPDNSINLLKKLGESNISLTYASPCFYANYLLKYGSPEQVCSNQKVKDKIVAACMKDYYIASSFAPYLNQPLPPLPTYHAFEGYEKHKQWLSLSYEHYLPEHVIVPIKRIKIPDEQFTLKPITILPGIDGVLSGKLISLITFLYFSDKKLPIQTKSLEDFVLQHNDYRLFVGFFNYAIKHKYETVKLEEWTGKIKNNGSSIAFYAVSMFLNSIKVDLSNPPRCILNFITRSLNMLGIVHFSKKSVAKAFLKHSGVKWFFIRSIISLDINYFDTFPLVQVEFAKPDEREMIYISYFNSLESDRQKLVDCFISLSSIYFYTRISYNKYFFPIIHQNLQSFVTVPDNPPRVVFSEKFIDSLLNLIDRQSERLPSRFYAFFIQTILSSSHFKRLLRILKKKLPASAFQAYIFQIFPCLYFTNSKDRKIKKELTIDHIDHFTNKPPSFSRSFCRSLLIPIAPSLSQKFILEIMKYLTPVFPALSYPSLPLPIETPLYERILLHIEEPTPEMLTEPSRETFFLFKAAIKYANPLQKNELVKSFLKTLVSDQSHIDLIELSSCELSKITNIKSLVSSRELINSKNFMMYLILLKKIEKINNENWDEDIMCKIHNEERRKVFSEIGTRHIVKKVIACCQ